MSEFFEDTVPDRLRKAIVQVVNSDNTAFSALVSVSGLDKSIDFAHTNLDGVDLRNSDLRGFNFTGASLQDAIIDDTTIIDDSTILEGANYNWIERQLIPIVDQMLAILSSSN